MASYAYEPVLSATDSAGRFLENIRLNGFLITYWADGPVEELRILDIVEL
jgi:hypothetical protein